MAEGSKTTATRRAANKTTKSTRRSASVTDGTSALAPAPRSYDKVISRWNSLVDTYSDLGYGSLYQAFNRAGHGWANQPQINNARIKAINPLPADYTKEQLGMFLTSPQTSEIPLRQIAQILRWSAYPFQKLIKSYADMLTYRHYVKPMYVDGTTAASEEFRREWRLVDKIVKKAGVEEIGHQAAGQALTSGKVFYILRSNIDKVHNKVNTVFVQQLPQDWCIPIGFNNISKYTISFDMMYFLQPGTDYRQFGDLFEPYIDDFNGIFEPTIDEREVGRKYIYATKIKSGKREYSVDLSKVNRSENAAGRPQMYMQNGRWCYYVTLPIDRVWTFEIDDTTAIVASPLAGLLQTFAQQADYEAAQLSVIMNPLVKIVTGEIPYDTGDSAKPEDSYKLSIGGRAMFESFWNTMMAMSNTGGTAFFTAPVENIKSHDFQAASNANEIATSYLEYGLNQAGVGALIPTGETIHAGMEEYSAKLESRFADRIYRTLEKMVNYFLSTLGLKNEWRLTVFGSVYLDEIIRANALKQLDKGDLSQHFILAALDNMSVLDRLSLSHAVKGSGLLDLLIPPATSYTQASGGGAAASKNDTGSHASGTSAEGAPTKSEAEVQETKVEKEVSRGVEE